MFPAAQAVEFREAEGPSPEDCFVCARRPVAFRLRCTLDRGGRHTHAPVASVTRHTAVGLGPIHTAKRSVLVKRHAVKSRPAHSLGPSGIGQYRDRTVHMGRCRQEVSKDASIWSFFPSPASKACLFLGILGRALSCRALLHFWILLSRHTWHADRSKNGRRQPGEVNHSGQR